MITMATTDSLLALTLLCLTATFTPGIADGQSSVAALLGELPNPDVMPLPQEGSGPLEVNISLKLIKIVGMYRRHQDIEVLVHLSMQWTSPELTLNGHEYWSNNTNLVLPTKYLGLPDITVYNAVTPAEVISPEEATLSFDGTVAYVQKLTQRVICDKRDVDTENAAKCTLRFASWAHNKNTLSLTTTQSTIDLTEYTMKQRYKILSTSASKHTKDFLCSPGIGRDEILFELGIK